MFAVKGRLVRTVLLRASGSGGRTHRHTVRVLALINIGRPRDHLGRCPRRLSNNVHRHIVVTVTLIYRPSVLVTSRPAATLSIAVRTRVLRLVRSLRGGLNVTVVVMARSLNIVTDVYSRVVIVCNKHIYRQNATSTVFCRPTRRCAGKLLHSVPGTSGVGRGLVPVNKAPVGLLRVPRNYTFYPHYRSTVGVYLGRRPTRFHINRSRLTDY